MIIALYHPQFGVVSKKRREQRVILS